MTLRPRSPRRVLLPGTPRYVRFPSSIWALSDGRAERPNLPPHADAVRGDTNHLLDVARATYAENVSDILELVKNYQGRSSRSCHMLAASLTPLPRILASTQTSSHAPPSIPSSKRRPWSSLVPPTIFPLVMRPASWSTSRKRARTSPSLQLQQPSTSSAHEFLRRMTFTTMELKKRTARMLDTLAEIYLLSDQSVLCLPRLVT